MGYIIKFWYKLKAFDLSWNLKSYIAELINSNYLTKYPDTKLLFYWPNFYFVMYAYIFVRHYIVIKEMRYVLLLKIDKFRKNEQLANFAKNEFNENIIALNWFLLEIFKIHIQIHLQRWLNTKTYNATKRFNLSFWMTRVVELNYKKS